MIGIVAEGKEKSQIHSSLAKVDQLCPVTLPELLFVAVLFATHVRFSKGPRVKFPRPTQPM